VLQPPNAILLADFVQMIGDLLPWNDFALGLTNLCRLVQAKATGNREESPAVAVGHSF